MHRLYNVPGILQDVEEATYILYTRFLIFYVRALGSSKARQETETFPIATAPLHLASTRNLQVIPSTTTLLQRLHLPVHNRTRIRSKCPIILNSRRYMSTTISKEQQSAARTFGMYFHVSMFALLDNKMQK